MTMRIIGIDIGNFGVKTSDGLYISSKIKETSSVYNENGILLEYNNHKYIIGNGKYETETVKSSKENFIPLLIGAIAKSMVHEEEILNIATGLPLIEYGKNNDALRDKILSECRQIEVRIDGIPKKIIIDDVAIVPEGVGALYGIPDHVKFDRENVIIVDIGGLTTNIFEVDGGEIKKDTTKSTGMLHLYNTLQRNLQNEYIDLKLTYDKLTEVMESKKLKYFDKEIDVKKQVEELNEFPAELYEYLKMNYPVENSDVILTGGGAKYFHPFISKKIKGTKLITDIYANAKGYRIIGESIFYK